MARGAGGVALASQLQISDTTTYGVYLGLYLLREMRKNSQESSGGRITKVQASR